MAFETHRGRLPIMALVACCAAACGSSAGNGGGGVSANGDGTASVSGSFANAPAAVASLRTAVAVIKTEPGGAGVSIDLTNEAAACDTIVNGGGFPEGATVLQLNVDVLPSTALPGPGTYTITTSATSGPAPYAQYVSFAEASCAEDAHATPAQSTGTITLTSVSPTEVSGTFDVGFIQNSIQGQPLNIDHVTGQFTAAGCPLRMPPQSSLKCNVFATQ